MPLIIASLSNLSIRWKLLLSAVIPVLNLIVLSVVTYQSVQTYSEDEEQLNSIYFTQRRSAEYMRLVVDLETGFRGFVLTQQEPFLRPYRLAQDHILAVGKSIMGSVANRDPQERLIRNAQGLVQQLMMEKDQLIEAVKEGRAKAALQYIEVGRGRELMTAIRDEMNRFDQAEQPLLNDALAKIGRDRALIVMVIIGGGVATLLLLGLALQVIARSITEPLVLLAHSVQVTKGGTVPQVPVVERQDEIGVLTRVLDAMANQLRDHIARLEESQAELRRVNLDLSASESKYRDIIDHAPLGIFTARGTSILFSNRDNRTLAGLSPDNEHDADAFWEAIHPEDRDRIKSNFAACVAESRLFEGVFRFRHRDGGVRIVLSRAVPIHDAEGNVSLYQGFNVDITAREHMQELVIRSQRLATLGKVAAGIAHEIRNPLVGIGSTVAVLLDEIDSTDARRPDLEVVLRETKRLDRIVNQIIDYARPRPLVPSVFHIEDLIEEVLKLLDDQFQRKRIVAKRQLNVQDPCHADRDQIKQVLLNLLQNATEAVGEAGEVDISAFQKPRDHRPGLKIEVTDNGSGIVPADLPHVFEPFFTRGKQRGTGLGLAICHNIIESHHGEMQMTSHPGKGTTVSVWVPLHQESAVGV